MTIVAPSILSADFANLERDMYVIRDAGAPWAHVDIMDGHFVPNITIGIPVVKALRRVSDLTLDVHLMITEPGRYAEAFCKAGADFLTVHLEADTPERIQQTLLNIRAMGVKAGISVKPGTPAEALEPYLSSCDMILIMTVEPGFGGQKFREDMMDKLRYLRSRLDMCNPGCLLEVDGGVDTRTAPICKAAGANVLVSGSAFFKAADKAEFVTRLSAE
ncbi:MAG: ribulose-phosphate 3-epimerase [Faecousia sp.]